jgi:hypothetical protein
METSTFWNMKSHTGSNQASIVNVRKLAFLFWSKVTLLKVLCEKVYFHDAKSTCPAKDLVFFDEYSTVHIPKLEGIKDAWLVDRSGGADVINNSFDIGKADYHGFDLGI